MSVQLENGFTKIAHELLEIIPFYKFNGTQFSIIIVIIRYTYGFNRKDHEISLTYLTNATGIKRSQIDRELTLLIEKKVVSVTLEPTATTSRKLALNKHYDQWLVERRYPLIRGQSPNQSIPELGSKVSPNQGTEGIPYLGDKDIQSSFKDIKNITTKSDYKILEDEFLKLHAKGENDLKNEECLAMQDVLRLGIPIPFIVDTMKQMHQDKVNKQEKVKSFVYYYDAIKERFNKPLATVKTFKKNETDWDKVLKQMGDDDNEQNRGA